MDCWSFCLCEAWFCWFIKISSVILVLWWLVGDGVLGFHGSEWGCLLALRVWDVWQFWVVEQLCSLSNANRMVVCQQVGRASIPQVGKLLHWDSLRPALQCIRQCRAVDFNVFVPWRLEWKWMRAPSLTAGGITTLSLSSDSKHQSWASNALRRLNRSNNLPLSIYVALGPWLSKGLGLSPISEVFGWG